MNKIAIVNISSFGRDYPEHIKELEKIGPVKRFSFNKDATSEEIAEALQGYRFIIMGTSPKLDKRFFELQNDVKLITRHGIGYNNIDLDSATEKGVYVTKMPGIVERHAVAEQAVTLILAVAKRVVKGDRMTRQGEWMKDRVRLMGFQVSDKTTGIIGFGNIGSRVGEILKYGFNNRILVYDPFANEELIEKVGAERVSLETLLKESDFISLNASLNEDNYHIINEKTLSLMKKETILVNTARGELIDEKALVETLKNKQIAGFGTDVVENEPIDDDNPLLNLDNVIITPHVAVYNDICIRNMGLKVIDDVKRVYEGKEPTEIINKEVTTRGDKNERNN